MLIFNRLWIRHLEIQSGGSHVHFSTRSHFCGIYRCNSVCWLRRRGKAQPCSGHRCLYPGSSLPFFRRKGQLFPTRLLDLERFNHCLFHYCLRLGFPLDLRRLGILDLPVAEREWKKPFHLVRVRQTILLEESRQTVTPHHYPEFLRVFYGNK